MPEIENRNIELIRGRNGQPFGVSINLDSFSLSARREIISSQIDNPNSNPRKIALYCTETDEERYYTQDDLDIARYYDPLRYEIMGSADSASEMLITCDPKRKISFKNPTQDESERIVRNLTKLPQTEITIVSFGRPEPQRSTFRPYVLARYHMTNQIENIIGRASGNQKLLFINRT